MKKIICTLIVMAGSLNLMAATPEEIAAGKKLFEANGCVACHGPDGKAQTPTGQAVKARNFAADKFVQGYSEKEIAATIEKGVKGGSTGMQAYGNVIKNPNDRLLLAKFIMSLKGK